MPSRCIFFFSTLRAWSTLLSRAKTCTRRSSSIQRLIVSAFQEGPGVPGVAIQNSRFQVWRENFLFFEKFFPDTRLQKFPVPLPNRNSQRVRLRL
jgi:hypothetical protein